MLSSVLSEVSPRDPVVFAVLPAVLLAVGAGSSDLPARRASRLDPTEALREEQVGGHHEPTTSRFVAGGTVDPGARERTARSPAPRG